MQPSILIVDAIKSSLVMTSEVCKDKLIGTVVYVADSGQRCLELLAELEPDLIIVDFDLPDTDGVTLTKMLRERFSGPILMTAMPEEVVDEAVAAELFAYNDSTDWIPKPVRFEALAEKLELYLTSGKRIRKRFATELPALIVGKGAGRGKRAPKAKGMMTSLSLRGCQIALDEGTKLRVGDEVTVTFHTKPAAEATAKKAKGQRVKAEAKGSLRLKATIIHMPKHRKEMSMTFVGVTEAARLSLEYVMRECSEIESLPVVNEATFSARS